MAEIGHHAGVDADLHRADLARYYPQWGLRVAHAGLVLLPPTDVELFELAAIVGEPGGIVAPERVGPWLGWPEAGTDAAVRRFLEQAWRLREAPRRELWRAPFAVLDAGRAVGLTMLHHRAEHAADVVETWSWLARAEQGRGLGRRVRLMLLELAFSHLGAARAVTGAAQDNAASLRVSRRCGYTETRRETGADGVVEVHLAVTAAAWRRQRSRRLDGVVVDGAEAFVAALDLQ